MSDRQGETGRVSRRRDADRADRCGRTERTGRRVRRGQLSLSAIEAGIGIVLVFAVETPHGTVGYPQPEGVPIGETTVPTINGAVEISVWYV